MSVLTIPAPSFNGAAYDEFYPTKNTEELSRYLIGLFEAMHLAGFVLSDESDEIAIVMEEQVDATVWDAHRAALSKQSAIFGAWAAAHQVLYPNEAEMCQKMAEENIKTYNTDAFRPVGSLPLSLYRARIEMLTQHEASFLNILQSTNQQKEAEDREALRGILETPAEREALRGILETAFEGTEPEALPEALWTGQAAILAAEIKYLQQLQKSFKERKNETEQGKSQVLEFIEEWIENGLGALVAGWVAGWSGGALVPLANLLTQFGVGMLFDELALWLTQGNAMFDGLIAEDQVIQLLEMSIVNYDHRQGVLLRHAQQISTILDQINAAENGLRQGMAMQSGGATQGDLAELFKLAFLKPIIVGEEPVTDDEGNQTYQGFLDTRLKDLAYNEEILEEPGSGVRVILRGRSRAVEYGE